MNDSSCGNYSDLFKHDSPENIAAIIESDPDELILQSFGTMEKFFGDAIRLGRAHYFTHQSRLERKLQGHHEQNAPNAYG